MFPAFWLYGENGSEIDVTEMKGERINQTHWDVHGDVITGPAGGWVTATGDFDADFNTLRAEWTKDWVIWSLNSIEYALYLVEYEESMELILNMTL